MARKWRELLNTWKTRLRGQENMAKVRKALSIPLATNMCTTSFEDLPGSIALGSEDIILQRSSFLGRFANVYGAGQDLCNFRRGLSMHSNSHFGISLAAMVHLGAAITQLDYALDTHYHWQSEEVITGGRISFEDGAVSVPNGPGLGVEIDKASLAKLHQQYLDCGLTKRDDKIEMQKVVPGWKFETVKMVRRQQQSKK